MSNLAPSTNKRLKITQPDEVKTTFGESQDFEDANENGEKKNDNNHEENVTSSLNRVDPTTTEFVKSEFILNLGDTPLPDVVLLHLAKNYLDEKDCISLATSGASDRFALLFWTNR